MWIFRFNTEENINLLNKFSEKNKLLKQIIISRKRIYNDNFTPDISLLEKVDFIYCYISNINTLPIKYLNLAFNINDEKDYNDETINYNFDETQSKEILENKGDNYQNTKNIDLEDKINH